VKRTLLLPGCLALGLLAQLALQWHFGDFRPDPYPDLGDSLDRFPTELKAPTPQEDGSSPAAWTGRDEEGLAALRERLPYEPVSLVWRRYRPSGPGPAVDLYVVHTRHGDDRKHHPEICIREVAGAPEERDGRKVLFLDPEGRRPVQRFRFRVGSVQRLTVYYWHYSLEPAGEEPPGALQKLHRRLCRPAPSVTVQASCVGSTQDEEFAQRNFLPAVDAALRDRLLPPSARMGCDRLPTVLVGN
jgi:hypothetical protein